MTCNNCGNDRARRWRRYEDGMECCEGCGGLGALSIPDVYFVKPYLDPNLPHPNRPWEKDGVWVESKQHKAALLKEQGLREVGDKVNGARNLDAGSVRRFRDGGHGAGLKT